jgi:hypothetical protein
MPEGNYEYVLTHFGVDKVRTRFVFIREKALEFLRGTCHNFSLTLNDFFFVNDALIEEAVIDYFADLHRLKEFHNIEKAQPQKVAAYTAYWIYRRKPIQVIKNLDDQILYKFPNIKFINEMFAYVLLMNLVFDARQPFVGRNVDLFRRHILYNFKYRQINSQILEMLIISLNTDPGRELLTEIEDENIG